MQLASRILGRVAFEDPRLCLDHLRKRPERDPFPVGQGTPLPPEDQIRVALDLREQLGDEAALSDSRHSDDGHELRPRFAPHPVKRVHEQVTFSLAPYKRRLWPQLDSDDGTSLDGLPHRYGFRLPFRIDRPNLFVV